MIERSLTLTLFYFVVVSLCYHSLHPDKKRQPFGFVCERDLSGSHQKVKKSKGQAQARHTQWFQGFYIQTTTNQANGSVKYPSSQSDFPNLASCWVVPRRLLRSRISFPRNSLDFSGSFVEADDSVCTLVSLLLYCRGR